MVSIFQILTATFQSIEKNEDFEKCKNLYTLAAENYYNSVLQILEPEKSKSAIAAWDIFKHVAEYTVSTRPKSRPITPTGMRSKYRSIAYALNVPEELQHNKDDVELYMRVLGYAIDEHEYIYRNTIS